MVLRVEYAAVVFALLGGNSPVNLLYNYWGEMCMVLRGVKGGKEGEGQDKCSINGKGVIFTYACDR